MHKRVALKGFRPSYRRLQQIVNVFVAFALLPVLNTVNPRMALAQVVCEPWLSVESWTGTFSHSGMGSGRDPTSNIGFSSKVSMTGTIALNQPPAACGSILEWTGVFNGSVDNSEEYLVPCPFNPGHESVVTYRMKGTFSAPAFLSINIEAEPIFTWALQGISPMNVQNEIQDCNGVKMTSIIPGDVGFQQSGSLPVSGLDLSGSEQFQQQLHFGFTMDTQKSWTLLPSGQQPPPPPPQLPQDLDDQCLVAGSIIGCQNQTLGEAVAVIGTPFVLHYQSDRVPGRAGANVVAVDHTSSWVAGASMYIMLTIRLRTSFSSATAGAVAETFSGRLSKRPRESF